MDLHPVTGRVQEEGEAIHKGEVMDHREAATHREEGHTEEVWVVCVGRLHQVGEVVAVPWVPVVLRTDAGCPLQDTITIQESNRPTADREGRHQWTWTRELLARQSRWMPKTACNLDRARITVSEIAMVMFKAW